jgi:site-specific recombinase XerD
MKDKNHLIIQYLEYLDQIRGFAKRTIKFHKRICYWWKQYMEENREKDMFDAGPEDLLKWILHRRNQKIQNVTIQKELCVFRTLYQYLFEYGHIKRNPASSIPELICRPADEQEYLTVDECKDYLDGFDRDTVDGNRNYIMVALLWSTGLRSSELCALRWRDIDLDEGTLLVRKGKGGKQRLLFLNDRIWKEIKGYYETMGGSEEDPVFIALTNNQNAKGKEPRPLSQSALVDMIRNHAHFIGSKKKVSPRTFRHTFATHMAEAGVPLDDIKEMLGHDDETETCIYIHVTTEAARQLLTAHLGNPERSE